jgi:hypothetical protein
MFQRIDEMSLQRWTRHPMFSAYYEESMARKVKTWHDMKVLKGEGKISSEEMNRLSEYARKEAHHRIKNTFYDANVRSSAAHQMRFIYPFFAAHQDSVRFWGKTIKDDPATLRKLELAFQSPSNLGVVIDETGAPLEAGAPVNPLKHSVVVQLPSFLGGRFDAPLNSWMLMLQSGSVLNPGAGPMVSVPLAYFAPSEKAMDKDIQNAVKFFQPFGAPKEADVFGIAAPTPFKRFKDIVDAAYSKDSRSYTELHAMRLVDAHVKFLEDNDGRQPSRGEWAAIKEREESKIRGGLVMRAAASLVSPTQPQPLSEYSALMAEYRKIQDRVRSDPNAPVFSDVTEFVDKYGDIYYALTVSKSGMRGGIPPTIRAQEVLRDNKKLRNQVGIDSWGMIVGPEGGDDGGEFSTNAYRNIQRLSEQAGGGRLSEEEIFQKIRVGEGWQQFNRANAGAIQRSKDRGYATPEEDPDYKAEKADITAWVSGQNETWAIPEFRYNSAVPLEKLLADAVVIATDKSLLTDPRRADIRGLSEYLSMRQYVDQLLAQRAAAGMSKGLDTEDNRDIQVAFTRDMYALAMHNDDFRNYIKPRLLDRDPYYDEELLGAGY